MVRQASKVGLASRVGHTFSTIDLTMEATRNALRAPYRPTPDQKKISRWGLETKP